MKRHAFTLVELLVVIAIIGLLSTIAVVSLSASRKNARNTKRIADVKQLVTAFNLGLDANGSYPAIGGDLNCISSACTGNWTGFPPSDTVNDFFTPFITKPTDPDDKNSRQQGGYLYGETWGGLGSSILYLLEPPASCGLGTVYQTTSFYVLCYVKLY